MKTNAEGKRIISAFMIDYDPAESLSDAEKYVNLYVNYPLNGNQFSALVSLVMCVGIDEFLKSKLLKALNRGDAFKAATFFDHHLYIEDDLGDRKLDKDLILMRAMEKSLFLMPEIVK